MTFVQLKYILTIAETKSLNKAAEQLYVSQPSLTNALKELEKEVGITIFFRTGRGVTLTNDGVEFLTYAREIYREYEQLMQRYGDGGSYKKKFAVSTQHYSFAVKALARDSGQRKLTYFSQNHCAFSRSVLTQDEIERKQQHGKRIDQRKF